MKFALITIVLTSALAWSQSANPGHASKYATAGKKSGGSGATVPAPQSSSLAAQLTKIEQQGPHVSSSSTSQAAAKPVFPKTPVTQNKNRPMKFTPKAQPARAGQAH